MRKKSDASGSGKHVVRKGRKTAEAAEKPAQSSGEKIRGRMSAPPDEPQRATPKRETDATREYFQSIIEEQVHDITERKRTQKELMRTQRMLEKRVLERTAELAHVNEALHEEVRHRQKGEDVRQRLLKQVVSGQEEERRRLSRELHDQTGQQLTALILGLKALHDSSDDSIRGDAARLQSLAEEIDRELDQMAVELRPPLLDDMGIFPAIAQHVEQWSERTGIAVDYYSSGAKRQRLEPEIETTLFRITQEALTNVLKHAEAKRVSVILEQKHQYVFLIIEDDGKGFDRSGETPDEARSKLGLVGIEERIALVGGTVQLESESGRGTAIFLRIPFGSESAETTPQRPTAASSSKRLV